MVGHLFQNYDTIYVRFSPTYTCVMQVNSVVTRDDLEQRSSSKTVVLCSLMSLWIGETRPISS